MTCQELRAYFENSQHVDVNIRTGSAEVAEHIGNCADCNRLVEVQMELGTSLRLCRDSAPQISASLDAAVLANYRRQVAELATSVSSPPLRRRIRPLAALCWSAAVAATMLVAMIPFFPGRKTVRTIVRPRTAQLATVPQPTNTRNRTAAISERAKRNRPNAHSYLARRKRAAISVADAGSSLPTGFRSLMYCDQLSCAGAMEIIRMQLPSSIAGLTPASTQTNNIVFADVLVGPDGIARGIRIVE